MVIIDPVSQKECGILCFTRNREKPFEGVRMTGEVDHDLPEMRH